MLHLGPTTCSQLEPCETALAPWHDLTACIVLARSTEKEREREAEAEAVAGHRGGEHLKAGSNVTLEHSYN